MGFMIAPFHVAPSGPTDPNFSDVVLLLGFEGADGATATSDESPAANGAATFHNQAQLDTAQKKFGGSSLLLDGTDKIVFADSDNFFTPGDHTVEAFVRFADATGFQTIIGQHDHLSNGFLLGVTGSTLRWRFVLDTFGQQELGYSWSYTTGVWYHVCAEKSGNDFRVYADGVMLGKATVAATLANQGHDLTIGSNTQSGSTVHQGFNGWIDEVRITKGVARYASDSGYTVPTAAFPRS